MMLRFATFAWIVAALAFSVLWRRRAALPYNEEGRYFDAASGVAYDDNAVIGFGALAISSALLALACLALSWSGRSR